MIRTTAPDPGRIPGIPPSRLGFTLIELMVAVALLGVLAAVAVPSFTRMTLRARRSEAFSTLKSLAIAQAAYELQSDRYVACAASPTTPLNRYAYPFDATQAGWAELEWLPDGEVFCHYAAQVFTNPRGEWVRTSAICDLDDDNTNSIWWIDVDPRSISSSSRHMVLRPSTATADVNVY